MHVTLGSVQSAERLDSAVALLKALASPVRLGLVELLAERPHCVHEIVHALALPQPLVSQHLRVLRGADVVRSGRRGREVEYALADGHIAHLVRDLLRHVAEPRRPEPDLTDTGP